MSTKEKVDLFLSKWVSRKLTVFVVGSFALFAGNLQSADWVVISTAYILVEGVTDAVERVFRARNGQ